MGGRGALLAGWAPYDLSWTFESAMPSDSRMLLAPVGEGNCVSVNSVDADSMLVCRSSKLTEGRKSNEPAVWPVDCGVSPLRPKSRSEWLFEDDALSIGAFEAARWAGADAASGGGRLGGGPRDLLYPMSDQYCTRTNLSPMSQRVAHGDACD